jgi:hypothetical protein
MDVYHARAQYISMQVGDDSYTETGNSLSEGCAADMVGRISARATGDVQKGWFLSMRREHSIVASWSNLLSVLRNVSPPNEGPAVV